MDRIDLRRDSDAVTVAVDAEQAGDEPAIPHRRFGNHTRRVGCYAEGGPAPRTLQDFDFMERLFVDCHSHVCPSDDDGASDVAEGAVLCNDAAVHGSRILFATPHVWPHLTLTLERERRVRNAFRELQARSTIELRLGFELTPIMPLLEEDPHRYELGGTGCVLMEVPFVGQTVLMRRLARHAEAYGLTPVIAHPERSNAILADYGEAVDMAHRGWLLQVNATSITGHDGPAVQALAWRLIDDGHASLVASDGHREARPARIDTAWEQVCARMGEKAMRLFDGTALGIDSSKM